MDGIEWLTDWVSDTPATQLLLITTIQGDWHNYYIFSFHSLYFPVSNGRKRKWRNSPKWFNYRETQLDKIILTETFYWHFWQANNASDYNSFILIHVTVDREEVVVEGDKATNLARNYTFYGTRKSEKNCPNEFSIPFAVIWSQAYSIWLQNNRFLL